MRLTRQLAALPFATVVSLSFACTEPVPVANTIATLSDADSVERGPAQSILIGYTVADEEGDDQSILVEICEGEESSPSACGLAFEGPGSDNTSFVPTMFNGDPVSRRFAWDVACGRVSNDGMHIASDATTTYVARLRVRDADADTWLYSPAFTPSELGLDTIGECMR